ncbi:universal stress protein [Actinacidiphila sp. ITFR-21]|uniref:universal stress protein n=1 Tax=Actinacidiphila sp. ITFR-21 TaxID=3075199 RepID=UPI00288BB208|nr:universal stress protein [Streptomyces sp. ITFR-21]WNI17114.1 universal stress protein [Streptomyces sp. ITFR-21]
MLPLITVGLDDSRESRAAAEWAAREALRTGKELRLLHVWDWQPVHGVAAPLVIPLPDSPQPNPHWAERIPREAAAELRHRHPGLAVTADQVKDPPVDALLGAAAESELLVLGSRALGSLAGHLVGSVALGVLARAAGPVVLVRAEAVEADEHLADPDGQPSVLTRFRDVVVGLDLARPSGEVLEFAFDAAARRLTGLRVIHTRDFPVDYGYGTGALDVNLDAELAAEQRRALDAALAPWREKYPDVAVTAEAVVGSAGRHLTDAAFDASLLVVGRRNRAARLGTHIGSVTHAVLHHSPAPVAVIPHD